MKEVTKQLYDKLCAMCVVEASENHLNEFIELTKSLDPNDLEPSELLNLVETAVKSGNTRLVNALFPLNGIKGILTSKVREVFISVNTVEMFDLLLKEVLTFGSPDLVSYVRDGTLALFNKTKAPALITRILGDEVLRKQILNPTMVKDLFNHNARLCVDEDDPANMEKLSKLLACAEVVGMDFESSELNNILVSAQNRGKIELVKMLMNALPVMHHVFYQAYHYEKFLGDIYKNQFYQLIGAIHAEKLDLAEIVKKFTSEAKIIGVILKAATKSGNVKLVSALFNLPGIKQHVSHDEFMNLSKNIDTVEFYDEWVIQAKKFGWENQLFYAKKNLLYRTINLEIIKRLLETEELRKELLLPETINVLLCGKIHSCINRDFYDDSFKVLQLLFTYPEINSASLNSDNINYLLVDAVKAGKIELMKLLLGVPSIMNKLILKPNAVASLLGVCGACRNLEMLEVLLSFKRLAASVSLNDHALLSSVIYPNPPTYFTEMSGIRRTDPHAWVRLIPLILEKYGHTPIPPSLMTSLVLAQDASSKIMNVILNRPYYVNDQAAHFFSIHGVLITLNKWLKHWDLPSWSSPSLPTPITWSKFLYDAAKTCKDPKQVAIIILSLKEQSLTLRRLQEAKTAEVAGEESAMERTLVGRISLQYEKEIQPFFKDKFNQMGGLDAIELEIKKAILDRIIATADEPLKSNIQSRKNNILKSVKSDLDWARQHFTKNDDIFEVAWRAYDPQAACVEWPNLLTQPPVNKGGNPIFSIAETGEGTVTLSEGVKIIRTMAAYYFLVATDERLRDQTDHPKTPSQRETALLAFIASIAEIRRAHPSTQDNPSCFPGCFTRLYEVTKRNPHINPVRTPPYLALEEIFINELDKFLARQFSVINSVEEAYKLQDALNALAEKNAWDIIEKPETVICLSRMDEDETSYTPELLATRQEFFKFFRPEALFETLQKSMLEKYQIVLKEEDLIHFRAFLTDIGGGLAGPFISAAFQTRLQAIEADEALQRQAPVSRLVQFSVPMTERFKAASRDYFLIMNKIDRNPAISSNPEHKNLIDRGFVTALMASIQESRKSNPAHAEKLLDEFLKLNFQLENLVSKYSDAAKLKK
jgi:hypothetical protein